MSFVPVYLRQSSHAIRKSDTSNTLSLSPAAATVEFAQSRNFSNGRPNSKCLDMCDFSNNLEFQQAMLSKHRDVVKCRPTYAIRGESRVAGSRPLD